MLVKSLCRLLRHTPGLSDHVSAERAVPIFPTDPTYAPPDDTSGWSIIYGYSTPVYAHAQLGALDPDEEITRGMRNRLCSHAWHVKALVG